MPASFVKLALGLPPPASATSLFFDIVNNPMGLLITVIFSDVNPVPPIILVDMSAATLLAPTPQTIFAAAPFVKLAFIFPIFAFAAPFHLRHSLLVSHGQPLLMRLAGSFIFRLLLVILAGVFTLAFPALPL